MNSYIKRTLCLFLVGIFFVSMSSPAFAANKQFMNNISSDYSGLESVFSKGYNTYQSSTVKQFENYRAKQENILNRFINQAKQDEQQLIQKLSRDAEQLEKQYGNTANIRDYKNKINQHYLNSPMNRYSQSINPHYLGSYMAHYKNATNQHYLGSAMMNYKNAVNQHYLNSPMMKYKNAVNPHYLDSPMMKLKNASNPNYLNSVMYQYKLGRISQSQASAQWNAARQKEKEALQKIINQSKQGITQIASNSKEAILTQQMSTVNGILKQRADTLDAISRLRASYFGSGISFDSFIPDLGEINVFINGKWLGFQQPPRMEYGTTLVPMRAIFEELGAEVKWNQKTKGITASKGSTNVSLTLNQKAATVNGKKVSLSVPPKAINGHTLVPLRFVSESLGANVKWDGKNNSVFITN